MLACVAVSISSGFRGLCEQCVAVCCSALQCVCFVLPGNGICWSLYPQWIQEFALVVECIHVYHIDTCTYTLFHSLSLSRCLSLAISLLLSLCCCLSFNVALSLSLSLSVPISFAHSQTTCQGLLSPVDSNLTSMHEKLNRIFKRKQELCAESSKKMCEYCKKMYFFKNSLCLKNLPATVFHPQWIQGYA